MLKRLFAPALSRNWQNRRLAHSWSLAQANERHRLQLHPKARIRRNWRCTSRMIAARLKRPAPSMSINIPILRWQPRRLAQQLSIMEALNCAGKNLKALCQRCHMLHDREEHRRRGGSLCGCEKRWVTCSSTFTAHSLAFDENARTRSIDNVTKLIWRRMRSPTSRGAKWHLRWFRRPPSIALDDALAMS